MDIISILLSRELFDNEIIINNNPPIYAAIQKNNYIYIYNNNLWGELSREKLISFMNKFQNKLIKVLAEWKQTNKT